MSDKRPLFSIIVVSLNPGDKLIETIDSIRGQSFADYQIVVKDGGSKDNSLNALREKTEQDPELAARVLIVEERDKSIYEGMNQATAHADGEYFYFLNCGDHFAHENSLKEAAEGILASAPVNGGQAAGGSRENAPAEGSRENAPAEGSAAETAPLIFYGNIYDVIRGEVVPSNPHIDDFACYRHVPCHQACIYHRSLFAERGYKPQYRVRGDYEHFLWSYFCRNAKPKYVDVTLASYEGGGFSETAENRIRSKKEHKEITEMYMSKGQIFKFKLILLLTLAPLRTKIAESPKLGRFYMSLKKLIYRN